MSVQLDTARQERSKRKALLKDIEERKSDLLARALRKGEHLVREAERERLGRMVGSARPGLLDRALANIGALLILTGKKLQARHAPVQTWLAGSPSRASQ